MRRQIGYSTSVDVRDANCGGGADGGVVWVGHGALAAVEFAL